MHALKGAIHVMNVGRMELLKYRHRSWMICCWSFEFGVGAFRSRRTLEWKGRRNSRRQLRDGRVFGTEDASGKLDVAETNFREVECDRSWLRKN